MIDEILTQIDHDYHQSISSVRTILCNPNLSSYEKKLIAKKILDRIEEMKKEVEIWRR